MKEYPEPNYFLEIANLLTQYEPSVARFLSGGWVLTINHIITVTFLPYLPEAPWPPLPATNLDIANDRDEAALIVLSTSAQLATPTNGAERVEELTGDHSQPQTVFRITSNRYALLDAELHMLLQSSSSEGPRLRLSDLKDSPLEHFLKNDLSRSAALTRYEREILCLPSSAETVS